ncbi:dopamine beta-hydroxylase-like [Saccostrea echinata]|uniref:dopamine beta-hydroxylase-like n=1 Tax=Saccostrea echinata TaxID=191078 RepID=UPI002A7F94F5|nr:dopamine beta-hydroxylase-like [Saccostrea echinata]
MDTVYFAALIPLVFSIHPASSLRDFRYKVDLDAERNLVLRWGIDYDSQTIYFELSGSILRHNWLAFGFSNYGDVIDADLTIFEVHSNKVHMKDCWTDRNAILRMDYRQNYELTTGEWKNNKLFLRFQRKFETCDPNDYTLDTGTTHIIFGVGNGIPRFGYRLPSSVKFGLQRVQLLKPDLPDPNIPPDTWSFDIVNPKITIPDRETTYWWYVTKLPELYRKHHIIKYEGIITEGNAEFVHHIEVFHCQVVPHVTLTLYNGPGMAEGKPPELTACREVIGAWAMGASAMYLPNEAGTAIGGTHMSQYVLLEVHLNNPSLKRGVIDSSGIRFHVTKHLRRYDSGIMELGLEYTDKMAIPPGQEMFELPGYCTKDCTDIALPHNGIRVYASQLHTHLTGRKVYTKHIRNGIELPELNRDNHYSPHFQEIRALPRHVHVLPGDALITSCIDSTLNRSAITLGGFSIQEEMCVNYIHYYPRCNLEVCKSSISDWALDQFFEMAKARNDIEDVGLRYQSVDWNPAKVTSLQLLYKNAPISMQCNKSDGSRFPGEWSSEAIPRIILPNRERSSCSKDISWFT